VKDFLSLRLYSRVARLGSISAAARECGLSQSQASRIISELETSLGARLLSRTTRAVVPTETGTEFLTRVEAILDAAEDAQNLVREGGELRGLVRISMPSTIGYREVIPRLVGFTDQHPALRVQVLLEDQRQDLVRDAVDVSIRLGKLTDSSATAQLLTSIPRVILAARSYLDKAGTPASPDDLADHRIIGGPTGAAGWTFERDGKAMVIDLQPHVTVNDNEGAVVAAIAGLGICSTPMRSVRSELLDGSLVELLTDWKRPPVEVHAYFPLGRSTRIAARTLVAYLKAEFGKPVTT
jgi:DNA-binding transcriptional LysR family regulator